MDSSDMTTDELSDRIDCLGFKLGLAPLPREALTREIIKLIHDYEADLFEDVLAQFHKQKEPARDY